MKDINHALKNLLKKFFNWHGRCSKKEYMQLWIGILAVNVVLYCIKEAFLFSVISEITEVAIRIWNIIMFFPVLFATMRRYHDSGEAGWKALLFTGLSLICIVPGFMNMSVALIAIIFAGGYMVTGSTDVHMSGLFQFMIFGIVLLLAGIGFCILNIKYILRPSDPEENRYGKPMPFN